jgi:GNAT superfamily N-acetyltransferase
VKYYAELINHHTLHWPCHNLNSLQCWDYIGSLKSMENKMPPQIQVQLLQSSDLPALYTLIETGKHTTEAHYFETSLQEQIDKKRVVYLAFCDDQLAGYVHLNFFPAYAPFLRLHIPEIQDLFVHPDFRRQGIGERLIQICETLCVERNISEIGIGVGMLSSFGAAQRLYTRLGYSPDGAGIVFDRIPVVPGDIKPIDDRLCLMLIKELKK